MLCDVADRDGRVTCERGEQALLGVDYGTVDVMQAPEIRAGIKEFSAWPTVPQLYVNGEFVGGCDILREMFESGELKALFETPA